MRRWTLLSTLLLITSVAAAGCIGSAEPTVKCTSNDDCLDGTGGISYACDIASGLCLRTSATARTKPPRMKESCS